MTIKGAGFIDRGGALNSESTRLRGGSRRLLFLLFVVRELHKPQLVGGAHHGYRGNFTSSGNWGGPRKKTI